MAAEQRGSARLIVQTDSEGWFAGVAYDVAVATPDAVVVAQVDVDAPERSTATLSVPVRSFVAHALRRHGSKKPAALSDAEARQIAGKCRDALERAFGPSLEVTIGAGARRRDGHAAFEATVRGSRQPVEVVIDLLEVTPERVRIAGHGVASLAALGVPGVKAPLGLMVVADRIEIGFEATLISG